MSRHVERLLQKAKAARPQPPALKTGIAATTNRPKSASQSIGCTLRNK
jgi:hypothetical protein